MKKEEVTEAIADLRTYFVDKIVKGDYEVINVDDHMISVHLDGEYYFTLWVSNGMDYFKLTELGFKEPNTLDIVFTSEERIEAYLNAKAHIDLKKGETKRKKIEKLKEELKELTK